MRTLLVSVVAMLVTLGGAAAVSPAHASPAGGRGDQVVRHSCTSWVWFGPRSWDASCGTYGITVLGARGATIDLGFSSTLCAAGGTYAQSTRNYFATLRKSLKQNGWKLDTTSRIGHPPGTSTSYRRQTITFHTGNGRKGTRGVGTFDYDFTTTVDGLSYCYQRSIARYAKKRAWDGVKGALAKAERSLAYSGPGAYED